MTIKKLMLPSAIGAALMAATPMAIADAGHQVPSNYGYFGASVTEHWFDKHGSERFREVTLPGIQTGLRFHPNYSAQVSWGRNDTRYKGAAHRTYVGVLLASGRYHFNNTNFLGFEPYLGVAAGQVRFDHSGAGKDEEALVGVEAGLQRGFFNQNFVFDMGARPMWTDFDDRVDGEIYAAVNLVFGAKTTPAAPAVVDSDGDGVPDSIDECPNTPAGVAVDAVGCPLDSDGDGVPDYLDMCPDTPAGALVDEDGCQKVLEHDVRETLYLEFALSSSALTERSIEQLADINNLLTQYPNARLDLEGHTDSTGPLALNERLSNERAAAVKNALVERYGVDANRISTVGKGPHEPIADNSTKAGRAENRRVEVILRATAEEALFKN
ncbi:MAG TPA: OmpA family protein [Alcanivoracaceae bacterium]|nr:OmpA family protein [Alcanivoracaceae bacterium]